MGKKTGTFGSAVASGEIPSVAVGAETATAVFVEGVEEGEFSPEDSGEGEGEGVAGTGTLDDRATMLDNSTGTEPLIYDPKGNVATATDGK